MAWQDFITQFNKIDFCQSFVSESHLSDEPECTEGGKTLDVLKQHLDRCTNDRDRQVFRELIAETSARHGTQGQLQGGHDAWPAYRITGFISESCGASAREWNINPKFVLEPSEDTLAVISLCQTNIRTLGYSEDYPIKETISARV